MQRLLTYGEQAEDDAHVSRHIQLQCVSPVRREYWEAGELRTKQALLTASLFHCAAADISRATAHLLFSTPGHVVFFTDNKNGFWVDYMLVVKLIKIIQFRGDKGINF